MTAPPHEREEDLVRRIQRGDDAAFDRLVELCTPRVYAVAYRLLGNADDAADMAQEAFVRIYRALPTFNWRAAFSTWVYRIVANVCYDELTRRRARPASFADLQTEDDAPSPWETAAAPDDVEDALAHREQRRAIGQALGLLPPHYRLILVLCDVQGLSYQEAAEATRINVGTIKSRLNRARLLLREALAPQRELFGVADRRIGDRNAVGRDEAGQQTPANGPGREDE